MVPHVNNPGPTARGDTTHNIYFSAEGAELLFMENQANNYKPLMKSAVTIVPGVTDNLHPRRG